MGESRSRAADDVLQPIDDERHYAMGQQTIPAQSRERLTLQIETGAEYQQADRDERPAVAEFFAHIAQGLKD
jgi:hypothetical protein